MKRVKAACICQTLHFMLKEDVVHSYAVKIVQEEVARYKASLEKNRTQYKIVSEETQPDGKGRFRYRESDRKAGRLRPDHSGG